jgi:hypothetical protein
MQENRIIAIKSSIKQNISTGDYKMLSKILGIPRSTAVSQYDRNKEKAVLIMRDIVNNKLKLIDRLKAKYSK